jgi:hypothetical protein
MKYRRVFDFVDAARDASHALAWSKASNTRRHIKSECAGCNGRIVLAEAWRCFGCGNVYATSERVSETPEGGQP